MKSIGTVPKEYQDAIAGTFDEIEWVIDAKLWRENMIGDDPMMLKYGGEEFRYEVITRKGMVLVVERWGSKTSDLSEIKVGVDGCLELKNAQYGYVEYKCRI